MDTDDKKLASIKLHPAFIIFIAIIVVNGEQSYWPLVGRSEIQQLLLNIGIVISVLGIIMLVFAYGAMVRARTTIDPRQHTKQIVKRGIYAFSRNPIYLGWFVFLFGVGLQKNSLFQLLVSILTICLLHFAVVLKEEAYLEQAFAEDYLAYKNSVRRWI